ncbi:hypothetical protein BV25DRAFT_1599971 [Artomyces pyxidatus]|uniref:Uncharacterized protein n=1 Tax=Artomyces pyxidatus TaxID=48021 RepID=A0ACB8TCX5_9AGAM|nr:hypothetical protein BV25DRAFT_1599971 [Artomyces pyxidatus]
MSLGMSRRCCTTGAVAECRVDCVVGDWAKVGSKRQSLQPCEAAKSITATCGCGWICGRVFSVVVLAPCMQEKVAVRDESEQAQRVGHSKRLLQNWTRVRVNLGFSRIFKFSARSGGGHVLRARVASDAIVDRTRTVRERAVQEACKQAICDAMGVKTWQGFAELGLLAHGSRRTRLRNDSHPQPNAHIY